MSSIESSMEYKRNYTKFSATDAHFCIYFVSVAKPQKFGK